MKVEEAINIVDDLISCEMEWSDYENKELQKAWNKIREKLAQ